MNPAVLASIAIISIASLVSAEPPAPAPVNYEKTDDAGRLMSRITFRPDGSITHLAVSYGLEAEKTTVEADLDSGREAVRTFREKLDRRGRALEREEMKTENGRKVTRRTKFTYDSGDMPTVETSVTE